MQVSLDGDRFSAQHYKNTTGPQASIVAKSIASNGVELTTFQLRYWRAIHGELMTHRVMSRNASSSRAEPVQSVIDRVKNDPTFPIHWGLAQKGMQADDRLRDPAQIEEAERHWLESLASVVGHATVLVRDFKLHKQVVNRLLEPWTSIDVIVTATDWENFFSLRCHPAAEPHIRLMAWRMADLMYRGPAATPLNMGEWHLPYVSEDERKSLSLDEQKACSAARCARVSYRNHDGTEPSVKKDLELCARLMEPMGSELDPGHWSPFEHQATPLESADLRCGNFRGWKQHRYEFPKQNMTFDYEKAVAAGWRDIATECVNDDLT